MTEEQKPETDIFDGPWLPQTQQPVVFALEFWQCAHEDKPHWWSEYTNRRQASMGLTPGFKKFRKTKSG